MRDLIGKTLTFMEHHYDALTDSWYPTGEQLTGVVIDWSGECLKLHNPDWIVPHSIYPEWLME